MLKKKFTQLMDAENLCQFKKKCDFCTRFSREIKHKLIT